MKSQRLCQVRGCKSVAWGPWKICGDCFDRIKSNKIRTYASAAAALKTKEPLPLQATDSKIKAQRVKKIKRSLGLYDG